eukprot:maker-scaffold664_size116482-snap-gene-0.19 protein:Tk03082 transcript:maker-scaffold664_size116482-snap-gene-0.19-mRNA-1 annotation:"hypothetical protein CGI_10007879"
MPKNGHVVEEDTVVLHQFDRGRTCPSPSPYPIKLETYLRMAKLKYENDFKKPMSKKGKSPWISLNGQDVADSQLAQEHIAKHFNVDFSAHLSPADKAIARGMRAILEDHLYFCYAYERWVLQSGNFLTGLVMRKVKGTVKQQCEGQGLGRHSQADQEKMAQMDLKSVSDYLADKPFLMGDKPTEVDCVLFGFSTIGIYCTPKHSVYYKASVEDFPNLKDHNDRMRELFWPDWDDTQGKLVLHQLDRGKTCPSGSCYVLKLETYMRMAKLSYELDFKKPMSKKDKTPWISYNGRAIADSQLAQEFLAEEFNLDFSTHLSPEEKAVARGLRSILEDHFYFAFSLDQWVYSDAKHVLDYFAPLPVPKFLQGFLIKRFKAGIKKQCHGQGLGRHTQKEVETMGVEDLKHISEFLGTNPFMMGDKPSEIDCVVFGMICMCYYTAPADCPYYKAVVSDYPNLKDHCERLKELYWPDWEECLWRSQKK